MLHIEFLNGGNAAHARDLALDALESAGGKEHGLPGVLFIAGHVVVGVVAGHHHQRAEDDFLVTGVLHGGDHGFHFGLLRLALHGADEDILVAQFGHLRDHLAVGDLGGVGGAVAHEHKSSAVRGGLVAALVPGVGQSGGHQRFGGGGLVGVDDGGVVTHGAQHRLGHGDGFELVAVRVQSFHHLVVLGAVHQVGGLHQQLLDAVLHGALESLIHVVDGDALPGLNVVDDDLGGEGAADAPVGEGGGQGLFDAADVLGAAVVEAGAEAHHEDLLLADAVGVEGIIQRAVAGITAKVVGVGVLAFHQFLLRVGKGVPGGLGGGALLIGLVGALLDIDGVDQRGHLVCGGLVGVDFRFRRRHGRLRHRGGGFIGLAAAPGEQAKEQAEGTEQCHGFFHLIFLLCKKSFRSDSQPKGLQHKGVLQRQRATVPAPKNRAEQTNYSWSSSQNTKQVS